MSCFMVCIRSTNPGDLFLTDVPVFTVVRSIALLRTRTGKVITTCILTVLALVAFVVNTVRSRRSNAMEASVLL